MAKEKVKKKKSGTVGAVNGVDDMAVGGWELGEFVANKCASLDVEKANNLVQLFDEGNEVPFIARYRRNLIGDLPVEDIRIALSAYNTAKLVAAVTFTF